ncbi:MAG: hypothetical protein J6P07_03775, partial [Spirochaetaceae bacterium]|nr:hypothetical protein [Spirochaetaceae bacterium]
ERKTALAKLFPIDDYRLITEFAKNKADEFINSQKQITAQIENLQKTFDFEHAEEQIQKLTETEESYNAELAEINSFQMQLAAQLEKARALNQKFDDLEQLNGENAAILAQKGFIESLNLKLEQNRRALLIKPVYESYKDLENRLGTSALSLEETEKSLAGAQAEKARLENDKPLYEEKKARLAELPAMIHELERAAAVEKDMVELRETCTVEAQRKDSLNEKLEKTGAFLDSLKREAAALEAAILPQEELDRVFEEATKNCDDAQNKKKYLEEYQKLEKNVQLDKEGLDSSCARYENAKKNLELLKVEIAELEKELNVHNQNEKAFSLAKDLKEGEPCPVCGSVHHPKLADFLSGDFSVEERLNQKKANLPEAESIERETFGIYSGVKSRYEDVLKRFESAEKPCFDAAEMLSLAIKNKNEATTKREKNRQNTNKLNDNRRRQDNLIKERESVQNELNTILQNYTALNTKFENLKGNFDLLTKDRLKPGETALSAIENFKLELNNLQNETDAYEEQCGAVTKLINEYSATKELIFGQTEKLKKELAVSETTLQKELSAHGFDSLETLKTSFLHEDERISFEKQSDEWNARKEQLAGMTDKLASEIKGLERP